MRIEMIERHQTEFPKVSVFGFGFGAVAVRRLREWLGQESQLKTGNVFPLRMEEIP